MILTKKTVRKIVSEKGYRIPVETLKRICDGRGILLSKFFLLLEKTSGD